MTDLLAGFAETPIDEINKVIERLSASGGPNLKQALIDVMFMVNNGLNIVPLDLFHNRDAFEERSFGGSYDLSSLAYALEKIPFCSVFSKIHRVVSFDLAIRSDITNLEHGHLAGLQLSTSDGLKVVTAGKQPRILEYIRIKKDGVLFRSLIYVIEKGTGERVDFTCVTIGDEMYLLKYHKLVAGELVGSELYPFDGNRTGLIVNGEKFVVGDRIIEVVFLDNVEIEYFVNNTPGNNFDGYVFGINGREFKVKETQSLDLFYSDKLGKAVGHDGFEIDVIDVPDSISGVCEFEDTLKGFKFKRCRPDKRRAQGKLEFNSLKYVVGYEYVKQIMLNYRKERLNYLVDIYPYSSLASMFTSSLNFSNKKRIMISPYLIHCYFSSEGIYVNEENINKLYAAMGGTDKFTWIYERDVSQVNLPVKIYATRKEIYYSMSKNNFSGDAFLVATLVANHLNKIVSTRRIVLMAARGELIMMNSIITSRFFDSIHLKFINRLFDRVLYETPCKTAIQFLVNYNKNNMANKNFVMEYDHLKLECDELMAHNLSDEVMQEVGDVIMMVVKVVLHIYTNKKAMYDENAYIWDILFSLNVMNPFFQKVLGRGQDIQCVRSHGSATNHICSNGCEFNRNKK